MIENALRVVVVLMGGYAIVIVALFGAAFFRGRRWKKKAQLTAELSPKINASLVAYLAGNDDLAPLRSFVAISRSDVTSAMLGFQDAIAGSARERFCALALHLELLDEWRRRAAGRTIDLRDLSWPAVAKTVLLRRLSRSEWRRALIQSRMGQTTAFDRLSRSSSWSSHHVANRRAAFAGIAFVYAYEPCRRVIGNILVDALKDPDREVRVSAAQALARFGSSDEVEQVFRMAIEGDFVTRVSVAGPLRNHVLELSKGPVKEALRSDNAVRILAALELVVTWERSLPLEGLDELMAHREPAIRIQALHAVPLVVASRENEAAVIKSLTDANPEVAMAAVSAVERLRIMAAMPLLARCCRSGNASLARAAARAMAVLPPHGWETLQELLAGEDPVIVRAASEALEYVRAPRGT